MPQPHTAPVIAVPVPVGGMDTRAPFTDVDPNFAPWLLNWEPEAQYLRVRDGHARVHHHIDIESETDIIQYLTGLVSVRDGSDYTLLASTYTLALTGHHSQVYKVDDTNPATRVALRNGAGASVAAVGRFAGRDGVMLGGDLYSWNGATLSTAGFTGDAGTLTLSSYKGRVYMFQGVKMFYSVLAGVTGATTEIDLSTLFESSMSITWSAVLTSPTQNSDSTYLAFGNAAGEVLMYGGDNPESPNWAQVARFTIPRPLFTRAAIEINNDIWVATETGLVSLQKCFQKNLADPDGVSMSARIDSYWSKSVAAAAAAGGVYSTCASMAYWPERNRLYALLKGFLEQDGAYTASASTMFVYNLISRAWTVQKVWGAASAIAPSLTYHNNALYFCGFKEIMKIADGNGYSDAYDINSGAIGAFTEPIEIELHSAYSNYGAAQTSKQLVGCDPIIKTDFSGSQIGMRAAADFDRKVSAASYLNLLDGRQMPHYSVGVEGSYLQYRITGTSDIASTDGYELYSMGVSIK